MDRLSRNVKWHLSLTVLVLSSALTTRLAGTAWWVIGVVLAGCVLLVMAAVCVVPVLVTREDRRPGLDHAARGWREVVATRPAAPAPIVAAGERAA